MINQTPVIEARDIFFSYEMDGEHSLKGMSCRIYRGQKIAFMGANGSGKSTFFLCCNGIHEPESGTLLYDGCPAAYDRKGLARLRSKVGIVFQDPDNQLFSASVYQEISFGILNQGIEEQEARQEVEKIIDQLGITDYRRRPVHALSGGQKKLVSIADILVMHPEVIILDEPSAALDPKHTQLVNGLMEQFTEQGITVLMATHDIDYAYEWADEIILMDGGSVLKQGAPVDICTNLEALEKSNLRVPTVLRLFNKLKKSGILPKTLSPPRSMEELEQYVEERVVK